MTEKLTQLQVDGQTGISIELELTSDEVLERNELAKEDAKLIALSEARTEARTSALAKLAALGLTEEEIGAL
jgi:hypothetical protein